MSPDLIAALLRIGLRVVDLVEARGKPLEEQLLRDRTLLRRALAQQAADEAEAEATD